MMVTMVATFARLIQYFWIKSVNQLIAQATIIVAKKKDVRRMFAKKLIARPTITVESNKSAFKVLSHVQTLSAAPMNTAMEKQVDHTDVTAERMSTNVRKLNAVFKLTVPLILFVKRTNVNNLNVVPQPTAIKNSVDLAKYVKMDFANVNSTNALLGNVRLDKTAILILCVLTANVYNKNAVSTKTAMINSVDLARYVKMDFAYVIKQTTNANLENVLNTLIVLIHTTNMAASAISNLVNALLRCTVREHVTVTNTVLLA